MSGPTVRVRLVDGPRDGWVYDVPAHGDVVAGEWQSDLPPTEITTPNGVYVPVSEHVYVWDAARAAAPPVEPRMADSINGLDEIALVEAAENFLRWWRDGGRVGDTRDAIEPVIVAAARLARAAAPPVEPKPEWQWTDPEQTNAGPRSPDPVAGLRAAIPTTSPDLFHGHHPMCGWTIEADPKACDCVVALLASDKPGLDEERLARALFATRPGLYPESWPDDDPEMIGPDPREDAAVIAAEYARLSGGGS